MIEGLDIIQGIVEQGLIYAIIVAGIYLSSCIINFDDLSVEGSFGVGGAIAAVTVASGLCAGIGLVGAMIAGALSGMCTGLLNTKLKLNNLISGIVVTTGLFSITLKIAGANLALGGKPTIFSMVPDSLAAYKFLIILLPINLAIIYGMKWFLDTESGFLVRAVGDNPQMLTNLGKSTDFYKTLGLMISNMLAALSGALFVQKVGYFSIWANVGILIVSLAGLILSEAITKKFGLAIIAGAIAYQAIIAMTFELQIDQDWNKLVTALLIVALILIKNIWKKK
jgi:putative ABC transport system permease protein